MVYDDVNARRTDWFLQFQRIDREVDARREHERMRAMYGR